MPNFFIARPVFAWVVAIFICLGGLLALPFLPVAQYPIIAPPSVSIATVYPGASTQNLPFRRHAIDRGGVERAANLLNYKWTSTRRARLRSSHRSSRVPTSRWLRSMCRTASANRAAAAGGRASGGHPDHGGQQRHPAVHHLDLDRGQPRRGRARRHRDPLCAAGDTPLVRRRPRKIVLHREGDARLASIPTSCSALASPRKTLMRPSRHKTPRSPRACSAHRRAQVSSVCRTWCWSKGSWSLRKSSAPSC